MTFIGKLFVMINLVLSLMMAAAAFGVYANRVDWSDSKAKDGNPPGRLTQRAAEIEELKKNLWYVESGFRTSIVEVARAEDLRATERAWYDAELKKPLGGADIELQEVVKDKGLAVLDMTGRPQLRPTPDKLKPVAFYSTELTARREDHLKLQDELKNYADKDINLTNQLIGVAGGYRGLRKHIVDERAKRLGILDELGIVEGLRINTRVESELILKRLETIDDRIQQLARYLKLTHKIDVPTKWRAAEVEKKR